MDRSGELLSGVSGHSPLVEALQAMGHGALLQETVQRCLWSVNVPTTPGSPGWVETLVTNITDGLAATRFAALSFAAMLNSAPVIMTELTQQTQQARADGAEFACVGERNGLVVLSVDMNGRGSMLVARGQVPSP